jgi:hypothetical protein
MVRPDPGPPFVPIDGPNNPMGVAKGLNPGRVTWAHRPEAVHWDGVTQRMSVSPGANGEWWDDANCDPKIVEEMFSKSIQGLMGKNTNKEAWDALFKNYNKTHGFQEAAYKPGEKITIKYNFNNDRPNSPDWTWPSGRGMPSPQMVDSLLRHLVEEAGVPGKDITLYDVASGRYISDPVYKRVTGRGGEFKDITFLVNPETAGNGRIAAVPNREKPIIFSNPEIGPAMVPTQVVEAKYRINAALFRAHDIAGVTLTQKCNFGSIYWPDLDYWGPRPLHNYVRKTRPIDSYNAFVDLVTNEHFGDKGLLWMIDGMYAAQECEINIVRFESFGDNWTASLFMSQDPVAIDSVGLDFLRNEPRATPCRGMPDGYMHELANLPNPPSGTKYKPSGKLIEAPYGVHEHWNNERDKKYSRNLGEDKGIELLQV